MLQPNVRLPMNLDVLKTLSCVIKSIIHSALLTSITLKWLMIPMGTTLVMAAMHKRVLHISGVGDSRIYSFCSGVLNQLTRDHSLVQDMVELGHITKEQARIHPERNIITRAIGIGEQVEEDYRFVTLRPGDTILLCTDGLSGFVTDDEIASIMLKYRFENICERLIECANAHGGGDNITAVLMRSEA